MGSMSDQTTVDFSVLVRQLVGVQVEAPPVKRFNPRPPGVIQEGSATDAVLAFLIKSPGFKTHAQICWVTGRSHSAVSWALIRLLQWKRIRAVGDPTRNARYFRYCAVDPSQAKGQ